MGTRLHVNVESAERLELLKERLKYHEDKGAAYCMKALELDKVGEVTRADHMRVKAHEQKESAQYYVSIVGHVIDLYWRGQKDPDPRWTAARYF